MDFYVRNSGALYAAAACAINGAVCHYPGPWCITSEMTAKSMADYLEESFPAVVCSVDGDQIHGLVKVDQHALRFIICVHDIPWHWLEGTLEPGWDT
jgi:hypothetical protein